MTSPASPKQLCRIAVNGGALTLFLHGHWRLTELPRLSSALHLPDVRQSASRPWQIDGAGLDSIDTAAALLLFRRLETAGLKPDSLELIGFSDSHQRIISGVLHRLPDTVALAKKKRFNWLAKLGQISARSCRQFLSHVSYLGLTIAAFATVIRRPRVFRLREFFAQLQQTGISAIPVISLVMFLIGSVMAYLLGLQAEQYGANIYVVDGVALGTVREFSPLLVSTVLAGRSGAAFTAQLGTMKLTEEVDAIRTLGMRPEQVLVLPRICALMLVLPLLVFIGSITALIGAALTCSLMLDITPYTFIDRVHSELSIGHYLIGLIKAPVFALTIGVIGCSMGFTVSRDTRSIGLNTTSTVVQCIVAVVLINAMFAVVFKDIGW